MSKGSKNNIKNRKAAIEFFFNGIKVVPAVLMTTSGKITVMENAANQEIITKDGVALDWSHATTSSGATSGN